MDRRYPFLEGKRIIVVDDEEMIRELVVMSLSEAGVVCFEADNGSEALEILKKEKVDFVISDIRMPNGSGIDLLKNIQSNEVMADVHIAMMSGFSDLSKEQAQELGAATIIAKPFATSEILAAINDVLAKQK